MWRFKSTLFDFEAWAKIGEIHTTVLMRSKVHTQSTHGSWSRWQPPATQQSGREEGRRRVLWRNCTCSWRSQQCSWRETHRLSKVKNRRSNQASRNEAWVSSAAHSSSSQTWKDRLDPPQMRDSPVFWPDIWEIVSQYRRGAEEQLHLKTLYSQFVYCWFTPEKREKRLMHIENISLRECCYMKYHYTCDDFWYNSMTCSVILLLYNSSMNSI